ncbi:hypothetical protein L6452_36271 [Arctium lappa]|uniref:Uncharacterized protein n=1 Tax=Arctium lappa TaxID=4217 RepID=A0ACB8Y9V0_ARCLA|nr:hypothetical protein L6452_36271 [Arctium lappa]
MRDESFELLESWKIGISRLPILIPSFKGKISTFDGGLSQVYSPVSSFHKRVRAWLDPVFSPGRVGGENWQSSSFSGGVFVEKKASSNEWQILMESLMDAGEIHRSG